MDVICDDDGECHTYMHVMMCCMSYIHACHDVLHVIHTCTLNGHDATSVMMVNGHDITFVLTNVFET